MREHATGRRPCSSSCSSDACDRVELSLELGGQDGPHLLVLDEHLLDAIDRPLGRVIRHVGDVARQGRGGERVGGPVQERPVVHGEPGVADRLQRQVGAGVAE